MVVTQLQMPPERDFGWELKPTSSTHFEINERPNGQYSVVLNHALLRGVTSEMLHWWFLHFPSLRVELEDIAGYGSDPVPAYLLWHPSDHVDAVLKGKTGPGGTSRAGAKIHIQEAMQYQKYGWRFPVDAVLSIFYCAGDGWAMGRALPILGKVMCLRIHYRDVVEGGQHLGVHYHYEVVIGATGSGPLIRAFNRRLTAHYPPEFFEAWHLHNTIEVGVFENFLPALYALRAAPRLRFARDMDARPPSPATQTGHDKALFKLRTDLYRGTGNPYAVQNAEGSSFL